MSLTNFLEQIFSPEYYGTVGGLLLDQLGKVPQKGDAVTIDSLTLTVNKVRNIRILEILVERHVTDVVKMGAEQRRSTDRMQGEGAEEQDEER